MRRWIKELIRRWKAENYRLKKIRDNFRTYDRNGKLLDQGKMI